MNTFETPRPCKVHTFKHVPAVWAEGKQVEPNRVDKIFSYSGLLWGFGEESESNELSICALVQKEDGSFDTPVASAVILDDAIPTRMQSEAVRCMAGLLRAVLAGNAVTISPTMDGFKVNSVAADTFTAETPIIIRNRSLVLALLSLADKFSGQ